MQIIVQFQLSQELTIFIALFKGQHYSVWNLQSKQFVIICSISTNSQYKLNENFIPSSSQQVDIPRT